MSTATENFESLDQAIVRAAESTAANVRAARASIGAVIFGQEQVVDLALVTILAGVAVAIALIGAGLTTALLLIAGPRLYAAVGLAGRPLEMAILYGGVLYMVNDNGIITTLNPETGALIKQGRLTGAPGPHFASPTAADGHIFVTSEPGAVVVVSPGGDLTPIAVNDLAEDTYATPAFADGRIYVRTTAALYAFGKR